MAQQIIRSDEVVSSAGVRYGTPMRESATASDNADETEPEPLAYSVPKAAKALSMGVRTVWALVWSGKIRSYKVGKSVRISRQALLDFIEQQENAA